MKEEFIHHVWQYKLFNTNNMYTTKKEAITIIKSGTHNTNTGPDFLNAQIKIAGQLWVGNIEIHLKASDWYAHGHEKDTNYDAVILHVVYEDDVVVFMKNNEPLPTLELKGLLQKEIHENYHKLLSSQLRWIPCENQLKTIDTFVIQNWFERLYFERLESKSIFIKELLQKTNNNFEAVLFQLLAKNFGLKVNREAFLNLSQSVPFSIIQKEWFNEYKLSALLFGQAGFLHETIESKYHSKLKSEYNYLAHKYQLCALNKEQFQFFRMRPANFPTIRIAQLVTLYYTHHNLFAKLMQLKKLDDFYTILSVGVTDFWKTHYTFETTSKTSAKKLTKSFIDLLIINTIIPLKFVYEQHSGLVNETSITSLIEEIQPEKNTIISNFTKLKIKPKNALDTQALLQLKGNYCTEKKCLSCSIGNKLLKTKE